MRWCGLVFVLACSRGAGSTSPLIGEADAKALVAQWQGAWVMPYSYEAAGPYIVYDVEGTRVTQWIGDQATPGTLEVIAPCLVRIVQGTRSHYLPFAFDARGQLLVHTRLGVKRGTTWFACIGDKEVVVSTDAGCRLHGYGMRRPDQDDGEAVACSVSGSQLVIEAHDRQTPLAIDGELLVPQEHTRPPALHAPSLEVAKQRAAAHELAP